MGQAGEETRTFVLNYNNFPSLNRLYYIYRIFFIIDGQLMNKMEILYKYTVYIRMYIFVCIYHISCIIVSR